MAENRGHEALERGALTPRRRELRLGWVLVLTFAMLSVLPLVVILAYGYRRNQSAITSNLDVQLARNTQRDIHRVGELVDGATAAISLVAEAAEAAPAVFHTDAGYDVIWRAVANAPQIDALYVSFEDGHHRVVTRINDARRNNDPRIPASAVWHASYIDDFTAGEARARHRQFFVNWPTPIDGGYSVPTNVDIRALPHYIATKTSGQLSIVDPLINPDTGEPVISLGWPVRSGDAFIGFVAANMTLSSLSSYLRDNKLSAHSLTVVVDDQGQVIAHPDPSAAVRVVNGKPALARVSDLTDRRVAEALAHRKHGSTAPYRFTSKTGEELAVAAVPVRKGWHVVIVAPTADFIGDLQSTNRTVFALIAFALLVELVVIYLLARYIARQIARISQLFNSARALSFNDASARRSFINEVADLQGGFALLQNALRSFAKFVPTDVVKQFVESGAPAAPGVKQHTATIFFCDLEGFSSQAETLTPDQLLQQLTQYFGTITSAIASEHGTIDKFIGDAVMAFWSGKEDPVLRACSAAIRAKRRMDTLQATWRAEGQPVMKVRIGLHTSSVLVGNIGSPERLSYTAIGDGVNVASRLEGMNKELGSSVCVSDAVIAALGGRGVARPLRTIRVKGRKQELLVYELLAIAGATDEELAPRDTDAELVRMSSHAADLRASGDLTAAAAAYREIIAAHPDDRVSQLLLKELE